jgi:hypothetical protein
VARPFFRGLASLLGLVDQVYEVLALPICLGQCGGIPEYNILECLQTPVLPLRKEKNKALWHSGVEWWKLGFTLENAIDVALRWVNRVYMYRDKIVETVVSMIVMSLATKYKNKTNSSLSALRSCCCWSIDASSRSSFEYLQQVENGLNSILEAFKATLNSLHLLIHDVELSVD